MLMSRLLIFVLFFYVIVMPDMSIAANSGMRFRVFEPCEGNNSICATTVLAQGVIEADTPERFNAFLKNANQGKLGNFSGTVVLDSPGGNLEAGVRLGRMFRASRISTELASEYSRILRNKPTLAPDRSETFVKAAICASACTLAFVGGVERTVHPNSRFGVHQFSVPNGQAGDSRTQIAVVELSDYLQEMGIDRRMLDRASVVPPTSIAWLSRAEIELFRIDNTTFTLQPWAIKASEQGEPKLLVRQMVAPGTTLQVTLMKVPNNLIAVFVQVSFDKSVHSADRMQLFPAGESPNVDILANGESISLNPARPWARDNLRDSTVFTSALLITDSGAVALQRASSIELRDYFPTAIRDLRFDTALSTRDLKSGLALIMR